MQRTDALSCEPCPPEFMSQLKHHPVQQDRFQGVDQDIGTGGRAARAESVDAATLY